MSQPVQNETIRRILTTQRLGVLATHGDEYPYTSLVGFAATGDLTTLAFATMRHTRKFAHLQRHPHASLLINSAVNTAADFKDAVAVTALGQAREAPEARRDELRGLYLTKFPFLTDFLNDPSCALVTLAVSRFIVVARFQDVQEIDV